jgi:hypothetical protein
MTCMRSWKSHRLTSHTWLGLNPQIGRPLSRIVGAIGLFFFFIRNNKCISLTERVKIRKKYSNATRSTTLFDSMRHEQVDCNGFAMERFYKYVYGHQITIFSDHKPLESIFNCN